jgi:hypothetical protein
MDPRLRGDPEFNGPKREMTEPAAGRGDEIRPATQLHSRGSVWTPVSRSRQRRR